MPLIPMANQISLAISNGCDGIRSIRYKNPYAVLLAIPDDPCVTLKRLLRCRSGGRAQSEVLLFLSVEVDPRYGNHIRGSIDEVNGCRVAAIGSLEGCSNGARKQPKFWSMLVALVPAPK